MELMHDTWITAAGFRIRTRIRIIGLLWGTVTEMVGRSRSRLFPFLFLIVALLLIPTVNPAAKISNSRMGKKSILRHQTPLRFPSVCSGAGRASESKTTSFWLSKFLATYIKTQPTSQNGAHTPFWTPTTLIPTTVRPNVHNIVLDSSS